MPKQYSLLRKWGAVFIYNTMRDNRKNRAVIVDHTKTLIYRMLLEVDKTIRRRTILDRLDQVYRTVRDNVNALSAKDLYRP